MTDEIHNPDAAAAIPANGEVAPPSSSRPTPCFDRTDWVSFGVTTALAFVVYWFTLAPDVTLEFSGILSAGAMYAGVPHPPGYPVWTIYSWFFTKLLPFSNIAWRVAVGSALATALACGLVAMMVSRGGKRLFGRMPLFTRLSVREQNLLCGAAGGAAGLVLGFSGAVWRKAVIVDIWALSLLLFAGVLCMFMRWTFAPERRRPLYVGFFLFGLLLTDSQEMIVALPGLVCGVMFANPKVGRDAALIVLPLAAIATTPSQFGIWTVFPELPNWPLLTAFVLAVLAGVALAVTTGRVGSEWKAALFCGLFLLLGLAFYFYIPVALMTNPPVNRGYPRTTEGSCTCSPAVNTNASARWPNWAHS